MFLKILMYNPYTQVELYTCTLISKIQYQPIYIFIKKKKTNKMNNILSIV